MRKLQTVHEHVQWQNKIKHLDSFNRVHTKSRRFFSIATRDVDYVNKQKKITRKKKWCSKMFYVDNLDAWV